MYECVPIHNPRLSGFIGHEDDMGFSSEDDFIDSTLLFFDFTQGELYINFEVFDFVDGYDGFDFIFDSFPVESVEGYTLTLEDFIYFFIVGRRRVVGSVRDGFFGSLKYVLVTYVGYFTNFLK